MYLSDNINFFNSVYELYLCYLNVLTFEIVLRFSINSNSQSFQIICFQLLLILTIIAIFDCRDLNRHKFQPIEDRRDGATISVKVDFGCSDSVEFIVILLNAMRFSSHLTV